MINFISNILISDSFAQATNSTTEAAPQGGLSSFIPLALILLVFYFLLIRPQQKKAKEHQAALDKLKTGDKVQTTSGIIGVVVAIDNKEHIVDLEIANQVVIKILKNSIVGNVKKHSTKEHSAKENTAPVKKSKKQ